MIFCSNYDGSVDSCMDDFINETGFGLNASLAMESVIQKRIGSCGMVA